MDGQIRQKAGITTDSVCRRKEAEGETCCEESKLTKKLMEALSSEESTKLLSRYMSRMHRCSELRYLTSPSFTGPDPSYPVVN